MGLGSICGQLLERWRNERRFDKKLYYIYGNPEDCLRVADALEWLCSPAANGLGEQLLQRANRINKCRVYINASADDNCCSDNHVSLNLAVHGSTEGALQHIAATIAHELTHAGDVKLLNQIEKNKPHPLKVLWDEIADGYLTRDEKERLAMLEKKVADAPHYDAGCAAIDALIEERANIFAPHLDAMQEEHVNHPKYVSYVGAYEAEAMLNENRVHRLLKLPKRNGYDHGSYKPEHAYQMQFNDLKRRYQLDFKPGGRFNKLCGQNIWNDQVGAPPSGVIHTTHHQGRVEECGRYPKAAVY